MKQEENSSEFYEEHIGLEKVFSLNNSFIDMLKESVLCVNINIVLPEMSHGNIILFPTANVSFMSICFSPLLIEMVSGMHANMGIILKEACLSFVNISKRLKR